MARNDHASAANDVNKDGHYLPLNAPMDGIVGKR